MQQVLRWIAEGGTEGEILEACRANWPDADSRPLITAAIAELRLAAQEPYDVAIGWCLLATRELFRRMLDTGDLANALRAVKQIADLARLHLTPTEPQGPPQEPPLP